MESELSFGGQAQVRAAERLPIADRIAAESGKEVSLRKNLRLGERIISIILFTCGFISILTTVGFTIVLGSEALRFFSTTEWLNANKRTAEVISAEDTILTVTTSGRPLAVGEDLRFGQLGTDYAEIVNIIDAETVEVVRGIRDAQPVEHAANTPLFVGAEVTLTKFFTDIKWSPQIGRFGILELLVPTFVITLIAMVVSIPLGLGAAIYISQYAQPRTRSILKPILEILAGVPTVVYGYFALTFVTPLLRQFFGDQVQVYNMLSAGLVVGILIVPTISSISEDAISSVPRALKEASFGLGATRLETVIKILLPAALSGIVAAVILGFSRAVGETMIVLVASGAGPNLTVNPLESAETMAGHIARISTGDLSFGSIDYNSVFAIGLTLFVLTLALNFASQAVTRRFREIY